MVGSGRMSYFEGMSGSCRSSYRPEKGDVGLYGGYPPPQRMTAFQLLGGAMAGLGTSGFTQPWGKPEATSTQSPLLSRRPGLDSELLWKVPGASAPAQAICERSFWDFSVRR